MPLHFHQLLLQQSYKMIIRNAKYVNSIDTNKKMAISAEINGITQFVPLDEDNTDYKGNTDYKEIMKQVDAGTLTIADAE